MRKLGISFFLLVGLSLVLTVCGTILVMKGYPFVALLVFVLAISAAYSFFDKTKETLLRTSQTLQALVQRDLSVKIPKSKLTKNIAKPLQELLEQSQETRVQSESMKLVYESIIESMDTGILILKQDSERIFFSNKAFFEILELPQYTHWSMAKKYLNAFEKYLKEESWRNLRDVITLKVNDKEEVFSLRTYTSEIYGKRYLVVNLDPIQNIMDRTEKEAWFNLMKVMSHEIINTIAPITSLTNNLEFLIGEESQGVGEHQKDIAQSLSTIKKRTLHLLDFIENYRLLAELPTPKPTWFVIEELFGHSKTFLSGLLKEKGIQVEIDLGTKSLRLFADKNQLEQVLINLMTNSVYALQNSEHPKISLKAYRANTSTVIEVSDNGHGIKDSIKKEVFVPFFTTRNNGSGIGLSLSRNIMNAHYGTINFHSNGQSTTFKLTFKDQVD
ncbi:HAMP domain-containing histidine kinase [Maribacter polysiphoniae]|uniref:histidine kinase n=2 Tax=Maribacter polysiphoniae TaxID=429344 RepID=A0A316E1V5_9FLAO|nr:HAMP domain-containing sensor histidine kinase [Maribacter polysiphoniae]MBD1261419.1 HAMP domain-containing histidine kinase [Maribacter polysiphoniae]PWK22753.1 histidine kinase/DNA gyrase B/HSP90-like ATPase [Maribacter polysiphoniae]